MNNVPYNVQAREIEDSRFFILMMSFCNNDIFVVACFRVKAAELPFQLATS